MSEFLPIANQIKQAREAAGLSQQALARTTGLQQSQISRIENGSVDPRLSSLREIARALSLEPVLIPLKSLSAVAGVLGLAEATPGRPAYQLDDDEGDDL